MFSGPIAQHYLPTTNLGWKGLGLDAAVLRGVARAGFEHPTPIQAAVIPPAVTGRDVIGLAETGSGKTAAFVLPLAQRLQHGRGVRGLILAPTREIALQTQAFLDVFGQAHHLTNACIIGGVKMGPQVKSIGEVPDVVVATPGRLLDHAQRRTLSLKAIEELVLDEADHLLDLGFMPQIRRIFDLLPVKRHTLMFSATMPTAIERLVAQAMHDPVVVDLRPVGQAASGIEHRVYLVGEDDKKKCLLALLEQESGSTLVFIRRKSDAEWLSRMLDQAGHEVDRLHSDLTQRKRTDALHGFRLGEHRILVATDIAARGLDIPIIDHVINFDLPDSAEDYVHRAGRTARGAAEGIVSSIATWRDKPIIREIERTIAQELIRREAPGVVAWEERPKLQDRRKRSLRR